METIIFSIFKKLFPYIVIGILLGSLVISYRALEEQKSEKIRYQKNMYQLHNVNKVPYSVQNLTVDELKNYIQINNKKLVDSILKYGIKANRIEKIISSRTVYKDSSFYKIDLDSLRSLLTKKDYYQKKFIDSNSCITVAGRIVMDSLGLRMEIDRREYEGVSDVIAYWERKPWNFLGLKIKLFGRKEYTSKVFNDCGKVQTSEILVLPK